VQLKIGRVPSLMGLEVIETVANANWSVGSQFMYVENFTNLGLSIESRLTRALDFQLRMFNGWDLVRENNAGKSYMARVGITIDSLTSIALLGYAGPEQAGNAADRRSGGEVLLFRKFGGTSLWLQADIGSEDPAASWSAVGAWLTFPLGGTTTLALRGDYLNDGDGARTSGVLGLPAHTGQELTTLTATVNVRAFTDALVRPELRYDHSTLAVFNGEQSQVTLGLSIAYLF
jgi:hypothetical protein